MNEQNITPFFWFEDKAEEAVNFYIKTFSKFFPDSKILTVVKYPESAEDVSGRPAGSVMTVSFKLAGMEFLALNGGPMFKFSGAVSFIINCHNQEEIDYFWEKLGEGGETGQCGWINRDKFGMTWQVVPIVLGELMSDPDPEKSNRAMAAMLKMTKLDIATLQKAYENK